MAEDVMAGFLDAALAVCPQLTGWELEKAFLLGKGSARLINLINQRKQMIAEHFNHTLGREPYPEEWVELVNGVGLE